MSEATTRRRISRPRIALMIVIDLLAVAIATGLYLFLESRDMDAALMGVIASLVFAAFFNLVIVLVSLKP